MASLAALGAAAENYRPVPLKRGREAEMPYAVTGIVFSDKRAGYWTQGSGVVMMHPRVLFSAAHVSFDANFTPYEWSQTHSFVSAFNENAGALSRDLETPLAGSFYFARYSEAVWEYGLNSWEAFADDLIVHYADEDLAGGRFAGWIDDGRSMLGGAEKKMIVGYPMFMYRRDQPNFRERTRMHAVGPFRYAFDSDQASPCIEHVRTGHGLSGGPVWVRGVDGWRVAAIYTVLSRRWVRPVFTCVRPLDPQAISLGLGAIAAVEEAPESEPSH